MFWKHNGNDRMKTSLDKNGGVMESLKIEEGDNGNATIPFRKIRIILSDPYATESSDDDNDHRRPRKKSSPTRRRIIHEVSLPNNNHKDSDEKSSEKGLGRTRTTLKHFTGVRQRRCSSWSAEIRDPFKKRKVWLGTFGTPEEASRAFEAKKLEFRIRQEAQSGMDRARPGCGSGIDASSQSGEQSDAGLNLESILIDSNGFLLGQFSNLDDDLTISD